MDWQQVASFIIVALSALLLIRHEVKKRRNRRMCGGDCGCSPDVLETIKTKTPAVK
ncbi:MAG: FeoB-associated Cys-rich membrane protein [bacterium]